MGTAMQGVPIGDPVALSATLGYGYGGAFPDQNSAVFYPPSMRADGAAPPPFGGQLPAAFIPGAAASPAARVARRGARGGRDAVVFLYPDPHIRACPSTS